MRPPGVRLIIPSKDGQSLLMTKEYRDEHGAVDYRLPGGKVADSFEAWEEIIAGGEKPIEKAVELAVVDEGHDEAKIDVLDQKTVAKAKNGSTVEWDLCVVLVTNFKEHSRKIDHEIGEDSIEVEWVSKSQIKDLVMGGSIKEDRMIGYIWKWLEDKL